eukprot:m.143113 g.143113  ORF g.143113 m.143113 type:complete len:161 (-) comp16010_c0_seq2:75-557(-)
MLSHHSLFFSVVSFSRSVSSLSNQLMRTRQYILVVPHATIEGLDRLKSGEEAINQGARTANKFLREFAGENSNLLSIETQSTPRHTYEDEDERVTQDVEGFVVYAAAMAALHDQPHNAVTVTTESKSLAAAAKGMGFNVQPLPDFFHATKPKHTTKYHRR